MFCKYFTILCTIWLVKIWADISKYFVNVLQIFHNIVYNLAGQDLSRYFLVSSQDFSPWRWGYSFQDFFCFTYACVDRSTLLLKDKVLKNFKEFVEVPCLQFRPQEIQIVRILWKNFKDSNKHSSHQRICLYQCKHSVEFWMSPLLNLSTPGSDSTKKFQNGHCTGFPE